MVTIHQLMNRLNCKTQTCSYGMSRTVLKHLDEELPAWAIGWGGFIAIFTIKGGHSAVCYNVSRSRYGVGGSFSELDPIKAIGMISGEALFSERYVEQGFQMKEIEGRYDNPLGELKVVDSNLMVRYTIHQYKNGKFFIHVFKKYSSGGEYHRGELIKFFVEFYEGAVSKEKKKRDSAFSREGFSNAKVESNSISPDLIHNVKQQLVLEGL